MPHVIDNSEAIAETQITIEQSPSSITSPHKFPIGITSIVFTARDEAGNQHSCTFRVEVQGSFTYPLTTEMYTLFAKNTSLRKPMIICLSSDYSIHSIRTICIL